MPYSSVFPVSQMFTSPLAVTLTHSGSSYKCIYEKTDISENMNAENYEITAEVPAATSALIADGDTVTINSIDYKVAYRTETTIGTVILMLSKAEVADTDIAVGSELLTDTNFSTAAWTVTDGTLAAGAAVLSNDESSATYGTSTAVTVGETYQITINISDLTDGEVCISEDTNDSFLFFAGYEGTTTFYFEARYDALPLINLTAVGNTEPITIASLSLKVVS